MYFILLFPFIKFWTNIIYISFLDTTLERNALMENVYPKLKEYLRENYGLEFQVRNCLPTVARTSASIH